MSVMSWVNGRAYLALILLTAGILSVQSITADNATANLQSLRRLRAGEKGNVIPFSAERFKQYVVGARRPYSILMLLIASQLGEEAALGQKLVQEELGYVAYTVGRNKQISDEVFFGTLDYATDSDVFELLDVKSVPSIVWIDKDTPAAEDWIDLPRKARMKRDKYGNDGEVWKADLIIKFVEDAGGIHVGEVLRPSWRHHPMLPIPLIAIPVLGWKLYHAPFMRSPWVWAPLVLAVHCFAVAGGMFDIIDGVPFTVTDHTGKIHYFAPSGRGQLGAEGFLMGGASTAFGVVVLGLAYVGPAIKNKAGQRLVTYAILAISVVLFHTICHTHEWKTGFKGKSFIMA